MTRINTSNIFLATWNHITQYLLKSTDLPAYFSPFIYLSYTISRDSFKCMYPHDYFVYLSGIYTLPTMYTVPTYVHYVSTL